MRIRPKSERKILRQQKYLTFILTAALILSCKEAPLEPDLQFLGIHFHYGFENELNTFEQFFQKDLVLDGIIATSFWLTTGEQDLILARVKNIQFFDFPDTIRYEMGPDSIMVTTCPNPGVQFLRIQYGDQDKTVYWYLPLPVNNDYATLLTELVVMIIDVIESKPEYQSLPPAEGGYI